MTPSIKTSARPFTVTTMTTLTSGMARPLDNRKRVCSFERLLSVNWSWKPLPVSLFVVTVTDVSASSISCETGTGTIGPTISVRLIGLLGIWGCRDSFRQSDAQRASEDLGQFLWSHCCVRVADLPESFRIADEFCGEIIEPIAFDYGVFL